MLQDETHLLESNLPSKNGMILFDKWYNEAKNACQSYYMFFTLSTVTPDSKPSSRMLCLSDYNQEKFYFFTNSNSPKVKDLHNCPYVSMYFSWPPLQRTIRIEGKWVKQLRGDEDFARCPSIDNKITLAAVEFQSKSVKNLQEVEKMKSKIVENVVEKCGENSLKCPPFWIGFEILPSTLEFIKLQPDYASDRLKFYNPNFVKEEIGYSSKFDPENVQKGEDGWIYERLAP